MNINQEVKKEATANHKANMASSLKRRLEAARASNNSQLVEVLQSEMKQLGLN
jgi:plasmid maintenance system killer protein